ncbi:MAG: homocysteine S-methyltransferase family protein [Clostridia bacterium]|nr:homocysteine S-methyltransferase family protein [Clostridia bacterium]NCC42087.1 homocysteine S-methyltransferase family protein [Clostridia bacterium]
MTKQEFKKLTGSKIVVLDGATGSNLRAAGMPVGISSEEWVLEHPKVLQELQRAYVDAGSDIVYAPTFASNRISMMNFNMESRIQELNTRLVKISKDAVAGRALVAGDMTTTGKLMEPQGDMTYDALYQAYREQAKALVDAGVDLIGAETMLGVDETVVALDAVQSVCDLPMMCSLSLESDGTAMYGGNAVEAVLTLQEMGAAAVGLNCSVGPDQLESVIASMKAVANIPIIAKPNAGMPVMDDQGMAHYNMNADEFARHMMKLVDAGAGIIGGCCGTTPEYIKKTVELLTKRCGR